MLTNSRDRQRPSGKKAASTPAWSKPPIGPATSPCARIAEDEVAGLECGVEPGGADALAPVLPGQVWVGGEGLQRRKVLVPVGVVGQDRRHGSGPDLRQVAGRDMRFQVGLRVRAAHERDPQGLAVHGSRRPPHRVVDGAQFIIRARVRCRMRRRCDRRRRGGPRCGWSVSCSVQRGALGHLFQGSTTSEERAGRDLSADRAG